MTSPCLLGPSIFRARNTLFAKANQSSELEIFLALKIDLPKQTALTLIKCRSMLHLVLVIAVYNVPVDGYMVHSGFKTYATKFFPFCN